MTINRPHSLGVQLTKLEPSSGTVRILERLWDAGWPALKRWKERRRPENKIRLGFESFSVYIEASDKGRADFRIAVVNFSGVPLTVEHVELHWWRLASRPLAEPSELLKAAGSISVEGVDAAFFSVKLAAADIRDIVNAIEPSQNAKSAPRARLDFNVTLAFRYKGKGIRVRHNFEVECVCLQIPTAVIQQLEKTAKQP